ncbi:MAG: hypothetical protein IPM42_04525 [Saprospiraceae bacterium]|nr:hypothetical protein [Saprospiraceae bacterium]
MYIRFVVFVIAFMGLLTVNAQKSDNSPYSRFGIGDLSDNNFNHTRQMGGLGASFLDGYHINIVNPASYSFLNATAFDVGVFAKRTTLTDSRNTNTFWTGNLEYLSLAFPLKNPINEIYDGTVKKYRLGMAVTLMPHSNVSYNITSEDSLASVGNFVRNYVGTGGSYKLLWGNAIKYNNFSFGVNLGYLFGKLSNERNVLFRDLDFPFNDLSTTDYNISGFLWNAGLLYTKVLNTEAINQNKTLPAKRISVGLHANSSTGFNTEANFFARSIQQLPGGILNIDTINNAVEVAGKGRLPAEIGTGITYYSGERSAIGINLSWAGWSKYFNNATNDVAGNLSDSYKIGVGGYVRPDYKSFDNFFERVYYRYGAYYHQDPRLVSDEGQNKQIDSYGVTFGVGMPFVFQRKISHVNLGANLGVRGAGTPISERFVKISLGVTFNDDEWFLKRKYN